MRNVSHALRNRTAGLRSSGPIRARWRNELAHAKRAFVSLSARVVNRGSITRAI